VILEKLRPDIFVSVDKKWGEYRELIKNLGSNLKLVSRLHPMSTTALIERVLKKAS
jgi:hypothetical protein